MEKNHVRWHKLCIPEPSPTSCSLSLWLPVLNCPPPSRERLGSLGCLSGYHFLLNPANGKRAQMIPVYLGTCHQCDWSTSSGSPKKNKLGKLTRLSSHSAITFSPPSFLPGIYITGRLQGQLHVPHGSPRMLGWKPSLPRVSARIFSVPLWKSLL